MADEEREMQFDKLMEAYQNDILRLCYGMLNNMTDAEDALQDTFVKVWKSMHRYQGKNSSSVYTWIYRIAINTCKDYLRLFDLDQPFVHDEAIKERIQAVLGSLGYTDLHIFIQHFNNGHYMNEQGWFVQGGHIIEEDGLMDFVIDFECYFYGDDLKLVYFFNNNLIAEPQNTW